MKIISSSALFFFLADEQKVAIQIGNIENRYT